MIADYRGGCMKTEKNGNVIIYQCGKKHDNKKGKQSIKKEEVRNVTEK